MGKKLLEDWGFQLISDNMGSQVWEKRLLDGSEVLRFESSLDSYMYYIIRHGEKIPILVSKRFHEVLKKYMEVGLWWK
jgi:hypothetical protein